MSRDAEDARPRSPGVIVVGGALLLAVAVHLVVAHLPAMVAEDDPLLFGFQLAELVLMTVPPCALVVLGGRLPTDVEAREFTAARRRSVTAWTVGGVALIAGTIGAIKLHVVLAGGPLSVAAFRMELLTGAGVGGVMGLLVGSSVLQSEVRADRVRAQRDAFAFLNRTLRHHVLNGTNVIEGYAERLRETIDDPETASLVEPIERRSASITHVVQNVTAISETFTGPRPRRPTDLVRVVAEEVAAARHAYPDAEFAVDLGGVSYVAADGTLPLAVKSVIANAVEHNDAASPAVEIGVVESGGLATVRVADDGPGIPAVERASLFEPGSAGDDGVGLFLVHRIVTHHGGTVSVADRESGGTVVELSVPTTAPPERGDGSDAGAGTEDPAAAVREFGGLTTG